MMTVVLDSPREKIIGPPSGALPRSFFPWIGRNIFAIWVWARPRPKSEKGCPMIRKAQAGLRVGMLTAAVVLPATLAGAAGTDAAPDFSGRWGRNAFNFEPLPGQPLPIDNIKRTPTGQQDNNALVGDYKNPILKPHAAEI